jgi:hypothetical protein
MGGKKPLLQLTFPTIGLLMESKREVPGPLTEEVLGLLAEDVYTPWEVAAQVPAGRPELEQAIGSLLQAGLAEWFMRTDDSAKPVAWSELRLPEPDLADGRTWALPALGERQILLGITDAGDEAYFWFPG